MIYADWLDRVLDSGCDVCGILRLANEGATPTEVVSIALAVGQANIAAGGQLTSSLCDRHAPDVLDKRDHAGRRA